MNERFLIEIGNVMAKNEHAIRLLSKSLAGTQKSLGLVLAAGVVMIFTNSIRDKEISKLKKQVNDLEAIVKKDDEDFDFLK